MKKFDTAEQARHYCSNRKIAPLGLIALLNEARRPVVRMNAPILRVLNTYSPALLTEWLKIPLPMPMEAR